jgi:hypothetical protein
MGKEVSQVPVALLFANYNSNNEVEENEMGGACSTNGGEEERV